MIVMIPQFLNLTKKEIRIFMVRHRHDKFDIFMSENSVARLFYMHLDDGRKVYCLLIKFKLKKINK